MSTGRVIKEPAFIEEAGQRVAAILPIEEYEAYRAWRDAETQPESSSTPSDDKAAFEREKAAFERLLPQLLQQYPGKCVAIVDEQVVEVGDDKLAVLDRVHEKFGRVAVYVQWVTEHPRVAHLPYRKVHRP
jgi:hypothetical protein